MSARPAYVLAISAVKISGRASIMAPTTRQLRIIGQYRVMMEEAKIRLDSIDAALSGLITIIPVPALREFCFLQLRMLCELIALACLMAQGDIPATKTKKLLETWEPDRILRELERLRAAHLKRGQRPPVRQGSFPRSSARATSTSAPGKCTRIHYPRLSQVTDRA